MGVANCIVMCECPSMSPSPKRRCGRVSAVYSISKYRWDAFFDHLLVEDNFFSSIIRNTISDKLRVINDESGQSMYNQLETDLCCNSHLQPKQSKERTTKVKRHTPHGFNWYVNLSIPIYFAFSLRTMLQLISNVSIPNVVMFEFHQAQGVVREMKSLAAKHQDEIVPETIAGIAFSSPSVSLYHG